MKKKLQTNNIKNSKNIKKNLKKTKGPKIQE